MADPRPTAAGVGADLSAAAAGAGAAAAEAAATEGAAAAAGAAAPLQAGLTPSTAAPASAVVGVRAAARRQAFLRGNAWPTSWLRLGALAVLSPLWMPALVLLSPVVVPLVGCGVLITTGLYWTHAQTENPKRPTVGGLCLPYVPLSPRRIYQINRAFWQAAWALVTGPTLGLAGRWIYWRYLRQGRPRFMLDSDIGYSPSEFPRLTLDVYYHPEDVAAGLADSPSSVTPSPRQCHPKPRHAAHADRRGHRSAIGEDEPGQDPSDLTMEPLASDSSASPASPHTRVAAGGRPVIVFVYGGSWSSGDKSLYGLLAMRFVDAGYVVVVPNYALYPHAKVRQMTRQLRHAVQWTARHIGAYHGDGARIIMMGHSAGAQLVMLTILQQVAARLEQPPATDAAATHDTAVPNAAAPDTAARDIASRGVTRRQPAKGTGDLLDAVRGAVLLCGVYDIASHYEWECMRGVEEISAMARVMGPDAAAFARHSPLQVLRGLVTRHGPAAVRAPAAGLPKLLLIHSGQDTTVPVAASVALYDCLSRQVATEGCALSICRQLHHAGPIFGLMRGERDVFGLYLLGQMRSVFGAAVAYPPSSEAATADAAADDDAPPDHDGDSNGGTHHDSLRRRGRAGGRGGSGFDEGSAPPSAPDAPSSQDSHHRAHHQHHHQHQHHHHRQAAADPFLATRAMDDRHVTVQGLVADGSLTSTLTTALGAPMVEPGTISDETETATDAEAAVDPIHPFATSAPPPTTATVSHAIAVNAPASPAVSAISASLATTTTTVAPASPVSSIATASPALTVVAASSSCLPMLDACPTPLLQTAASASRAPLAATLPPPPLPAATPRSASETTLHQAGSTTSVVLSPSASQTSMSGPLDAFGVVGPATPSPSKVKKWFGLWPRPGRSNASQSTTASGGCSATSSSASLASPLSAPTSTVALPRSASLPLHAPASSSAIERSTPMRIPAGASLGPMDTVDDARAAKGSPASSVRSFASSTATAQSHATTGSPRRRKTARGTAPGSSGSKSTSPARPALMKRTSTASSSASATTMGSSAATLQNRMARGEMLWM